MNRFTNLLPQLYYFWIAAKAGNFTKAAKNALVSQSAISHQIQLLEDKLNSQLFHRQRSGVTLTIDGEKLFETCELIFKKIEDSANDISSKSISGTVRISAPPQLGTIVILDAIKRMKNNYPEVDPILHTTNDIVNFTSWDSDLTFNYFPLNVSDFINIPVICFKFHVAGSPEYLKKNPPIKKPADINKHCLISIDDHLADWKMFFKNYEVETSLKNIKRFSVGNAQAAINIANEGYGLVFLAEFILKEALDKGNLNLVKISKKPPCHWLYLITRKESLKNPRVIAFLESFKDTIRKYRKSCSPWPDKAVGFMDDLIAGKIPDITDVLEHCPPLSYYNYESAR